VRLVESDSDDDDNEDENGGSERVSPATIRGLGLRGGL